MGVSLWAFGNLLCRIHVLAAFQERNVALKNPPNQAPIVEAGA